MYVNLLGELDKVIEFHTVHKVNFNQYKENGDNALHTAV